MMKKIFCALALVAGFFSCTEDYTDWANPQSNAANEAAEKFVMMVEPTVSAIDFAEVTEERVQLFTTNLAEGQTGGYVVTVSADDVEKTVQIDADVDGYVSVAELEEAVKSLYGAAPVERSVNITVAAEVKVESEDGAVIVRKEVKPFVLKATPDAPFIDEGGYYLVGNIDGWSCTRVDAYHMVNNGGDVYANPEFSVEIKPVDGITTYEVKMVPASAFKEDGSEVVNWPIAISAPEGVDVSAYEGAVSLNNKGGNIKFDATEGAKSYKITVNIMECTYQVKALSEPELYMTGNELGWGATTEDWLKLFAVNANWDDSGNTKGIYWMIRYFKDNEEFKFAPQAAWKDDFGGDQMTVNDNAGAGYENNGTNCKITKSGWYIIIVDTKTKTLNINRPKIYLIGDVTGSWDAGKDENLFTIPTTEDGEFVSPAFANSANVRMYAAVDGVDWWRSEFNVYGTTIVIRTEGDQDPVPVTAGQKAYLKFPELKGRIE